MKNSFARSVYRAFVITSAEFADEYNQAMRWLGLVCLVAIMGCDPAPVYGQVAQIPWDVQQDRPVPNEVHIWRGETVDLMPRLVHGTRPVAVTNAPVEFRYREDSLPTNTFRIVSATANTNNGVLAVRWLPDYDAGAAWYDYQIVVGSNAANPRCFGRIIMRPTIGWHASTNQPPPITLYPTRAEFQALSNSVASALQTVVTVETDPVSIGLLGTHTNRADNPHRVTAAQIGALTSEADERALAVLATNRPIAIYGMNQRIDGDGAIWRPSVTSNLLFRLISINPENYEVGTVFDLVSDVTSTNAFFVLRVRSYGDLSHTTVWNLNGTLNSEYWTLNYSPSAPSESDFVGSFSWPSIGTLPGGVIDESAVFESFWSVSTSTARVDSVALMSDIPSTNGLVYESSADAKYAISNHLSGVAYDGQYYSLSNRPIVLASNGIASASHCWGVGFGGWTGWSASGITLTPSNAVLSGNAGGYLETVGMITGVVNVTQSGVGLNGYSDDGLVTLSYDGGANWYPLASLPAKAIRVGGARLRISMPETPGLPGSTPRWELNSVAVDTWIDSSRASEVFPLHAVSVRADLPSDALDVANKAYVDTVCGLARDAAERALTWWNNPAEGDAYLNGHRLHLGGGWSLIGEPGSFAAISNDGSVGLGVVGDSAQFSVQLANENILVARFDTAMMQILAWSGVASNMWLSLATNGLPANPDSASAWVEYSAALDSGVWSRAPVQATALPTNGASFRISFVNPRWGQTNGYFRVMRQSGNLAALRSMVPLRAPSIMISESNSVAVSTSPGVLTLDSIAQAPAAIDNHAQLYSVLGELWVLDGDGNATRLSTHDGPLWVAKSCNVYTGWGTTVDMISGSRSRFRLTTLRSWDDDQKAVAAAQEDAIRTWKETPPDKRRTPRPHAYVIKPEPSWITEQKGAAVDPNPIPSKK